MGGEDFQASAARGTGSVMAESWLTLAQRAQAALRDERAPLRRTPHAKSNQDPRTAQGQAGQPAVELLLTAVHTEDVGLTSGNCIHFFADSHSTAVATHCN